MKKDYSEALKWYDRAAAQGNSSAQYDLGIMYAYGEGVPKNAVRAYAWFNVVAAGGDSTAARLREETAQGMTPDQIAEAQRISSDFRAQPERSRPVEQADGTLTERTNVTGSGFFVTDDGYFVTNHHVIVGASRIAVRTSAGTLPATVVRVDAANDLAVLKLNGKFSSLCVLGSKEPKRSDRVATMGFPNPRLQGLLPKFSSGEVAALSGPRDDPRFLQISVPTQPGNSGGPLVDASGVVIGVIVAQLDKIEAFKATGNIPENVNYAIKGTILRAVLESIPDLSLKSQTDIVPTNHSEVVDVVERAIGLVLVEH